jgi:bifunctional non-homologous end joining protein LigD
MLPTFEPMLATKWAKAFDSDDWWFEVKWDGYRAILSNDGQMRARSRRGIDLLSRFPELENLPIPAGAVIDGEIAAFDDEGRPSFSLIQQRTGFGGSVSGTRVPVNFVAFDLLYWDGTSQIDRPYEERRDLLESLAIPSPVVIADPTRGSGTALFEAVKAQGLEGIVGKRSGSRYQPGKRSPDWRKVSVRRQMRAVVGGYVEGAGSRSSTFGSLLLGLWEGSSLRFVGAVGSGFDERTLKAIHSALREIETDQSPFDPAVRYPGVLHWVTPGVVVDVEFKEWTHDDNLRAPVFKGVEVAEPGEITWENEGPS